MDERYDKLAKSGVRNIKGFNGKVRAGLIREDHLYHQSEEFGDGVVIGENVHLSGHTVEGGMVKTGPVKLSRFVTVGLGSMVGINVEAGEKCQIGAMSVVLKGTMLDAESVYVGVPVRKVERNSPAAVVETALLDA